MWLFTWGKILVQVIRAVVFREGTGPVVPPNHYAASEPEVITGVWSISRNASLNCCSLCDKLVIIMRWLTESEICQFQLNLKAHPSCKIQQCIQRIATQALNNLQKATIQRHSRWNRRRAWSPRRARTSPRTTPPPPLAPLIPWLLRPSPPRPTLRWPFHHKVVRHGKSVNINTNIISA